MAVLDEFPGLTVQILAEKQPLQEYDNDEEESSSNTVTKYIEAKSGANFGVQYRFSNNFDAKHSIAMYIDLDGKYVAGSVHTRDRDLKRDKDYCVTASREAKDGLFFERRFTFSQLNTDDSNAHGIEELKKKLDEIGEISVRFYWVSVGSSHVASHSISDFSTLGTIPEKALKGNAVSHQASLQGPKPIKAFNTVDITKLNGGVPFATFVYKYRSSNALKALLIVPRTPSPVPLEDRPIDELTEAEVRELLRRKREREEAPRTIKQEGVKRERSPDDGGTIDDDDEVSFVRAKRRRPPPTLIEDGVEIVDLT